MRTARDWLQRLARLSHDDLKRISKLVDELIVADAGPKETANVMLDSQPPPADDDEARARLDTVTNYLQQRRRA